MWQDGVQTNKQTNKQAQVKSTELLELVNGAARDRLRVNDDDIEEQLALARDLRGRAAQREPLLAGVPAPKTPRPNQTKPKTGSLPAGQQVLASGHSGQASMHPCRQIWGSQIWGSLDGHRRGFGCGTTLARRSRLRRTIGRGTRSGMVIGDRRSEMEIGDGDRRSGGHEAFLYFFFVVPHKQKERMENKTNS